LVSAGGAWGYHLFWGSAGNQGLLWLCAGLLVVLCIGNRTLCRDNPLLLPATAALITAASGLFFQVAMGEATPTLLYCLRVLLSGGSGWLFLRLFQGRNPTLEWIAWGLGVLGLSQIALTESLNLGMLSSAAMTTCGAFPAAALSGLALDLSEITPVHMTAVLTLAFLIRFLPRYPKWLGAAAPCGVYLVVMSLTGHWDMTPVAALFCGGVAGSFLPGPGRVAHRRGETGAAQVKLEMAAGVLAHTQQVLLELPEVPVDENALVSKAAERACAGCPARRVCKDSRRIRQLPGILLHKSLLSQQELPIICRKSSRFLAELHRSQEQLRSIQADRERQKEYRAAVVQQYQFLSEYLQALSDQLSRRSTGQNPYYRAQVRICGNRPEKENGDRVMKFTGASHRYYVLMCDGMGTGPEAVREGKNAANLLRKLLQSGFPASHALQSLNSLCALRNRAGTATVDLLELELDTGRATSYKWGAAPSYLVSAIEAEKIGTAGPPPGLSVTECRETTARLSLRRGEIFVLVSDGIGEGEAMRCCKENIGRSPGELAADLMECGRVSGEDDATVITVRLDPSATGT
jgi:serine/threonine protein phosphatase PrpC